ncbi:MAG: hypothetical protein A3B96_02765 [Candidatus Spechtbacteria bacterium RIFCSPHIGHO2_02_FULL_43_15b]|uniref:methionine--tRNA ligase n=1 Tax=Candidatus Spechtbacteria bacterium RIFCSPHIGHO2_01_FULL_43_30 TaxID=1802158 RepID=A0A1G2H7B7_9BACT|nr:MAG: hypothetical protein A2827_02920 [Candidatus Spechtbacteria bacterium RIFCSPHIGHO2_01_FULL_43_30]OGZ60219.1 MAG: hypothetical protein A3B96_02765 [Candidatus Spechtbacteria bacterium RIFCSPHIGHO2_02_FULL_43_15b]
MSNKFYITTAIDYVNGNPHIGHAFEKIFADVLARYHRDTGDNVFFLTGTDEHGVKNVKSAEAAGIPVREFTKKNSDKFKELAKTLNISNDFFIRTTDKEIHWPAVEKMWRVLDKAGDIYKKKYQGLYCVGHEAFVTRKDLTDGKCALHKKAPDMVEEENYFFRLSKYTPKIKEAVTSKKLRIVPDSSLNELMNLLEDGLEDVSFSRPSKDLKWGVPVPGDPSQTIYVWCDALVNYISAIGYGSEDSGSKTSNFNKFWPADLQVIGKDILRFHAAIWPGMLMSAGLALPKVLFAHGFISVGGEKISKSVGNVIDPFELIEKYARLGPSELIADAMRYYLLREIPSTRDGDFTIERFEERYNADLASGLGNFVSRVVTVGAKCISGEFDGAESEDVKRQIKKVWAEYREFVESFRFDEALQAVWGLISYGDKFVDSEKIWELAKSDPKRFQSDIFELCVILANVAKMLGPFLPRTSEKIFDQLGAKPSGDNWKFQLKKGEAMFPRIK